jgi:hypothetical protein
VQQPRFSDRPLTRTKAKTVAVVAMSHIAFWLFRNWLVKQTVLPSELNPVRNLKYADHFMLGRVNISILKDSKI